MLHIFLLPFLINSCNVPEANLTSKCVRSGLRNDEFTDFMAESTDSDPYAHLKANYCQNLQNYPISCEQYENSQVLDAQALALYTQLYTSYKETGDPNPDCLGIARVVFCAYTFKYCDAETGNTDYPICGFLCNTWLNRCPGQGDLYNQICSNPDGLDKCSFQLLLKVFIFTFIFITI